MAHLIRKLSSKSKELILLTSNDQNYDQEKTNQNIINNQELVIFEIENKLYNQNVPMVLTQQIYKIDTFDFLQNYIIKTQEQSLSI